MVKTPQILAANLKRTMAPCARRPADGSRCDYLPRRLGEMLARADDAKRVEFVDAVRPDVHRDCPALPGHSGFCTERCHVLSALARAC